MTKTTKVKEPGETPAPEAVAVQPELTAKEQKEVKIIERVIENRELAPADAFRKLTRSQVELMKRTVAKGASDDELKLFIQVCVGAQLNPFLRQAHFVPFWDSKEGVERRAIIIGIDGFRSIAESSGAYAGNDDPLYDGTEEVEVDVWEGKGGARKKSGTKKLSVPAKATATVYKVVAGQRWPFAATARWSEYYPGGRKGGQWHDRPYLMLGKCAEALALRKAFPKLLSGMYAQEEMDRVIHVDEDALRAKKAYEYVENAIGKANLAELEETRKLIEKSTKYTVDQKMEFLKMVDEKINELKAAATPAKAK